jgi:hypothetical protein
VNSISSWTGATPDTLRPGTSRNTAAAIRSCGQIVPSGTERKGFRDFEGLVCAAVQSLLQTEGRAFRRSNRATSAEAPGI